jgi:hypothetical protein
MVWTLMAENHVARVFAATRSPGHGGTGSCFPLAAADHALLSPLHHVVTEVLVVTEVQGPPFALLARHPLHSMASTQYIRLDSDSAEEQVRHGAARGHGATMW